MKDKWDKYIDELSTFGDNITDLIHALRPGPKTDKVAKSVNTQWEKLRRLTEGMGQLISPIEPEEITLPYQSPQFEEYWKRYKEYLQEEHHVFMRSRRENEILKILRSWCGDSDKRAIEMLSFFIRCGYKAFFKPTERQLTGDEPATATEEQPSVGINITKKVQV